MDKVLSIIKNTKILGIVGAVLLIIGTFFNFYTVSLFGYKSSMQLIEAGEGKVMIILGIAALAIIFIDFIISKIPEGKADFLKKLRNQKFTLVPAVIAAIVLFMASSEETYGLAKLAFGFYVLLIGIIALAAYGIFYKGE